MTNATPSPADRVRTKPFAELRVIEVAGSVAGAYAAKFFADFGATVLKIEPPDGDPLRRLGPRVNGDGAVFAYTNTGKHSLVLDLVGSEQDKRTLRRLAAGADVVIESSAPDPLVPRTLELELSGVVRLYISPFGLNGPYAGYRATDFQDFALSGHMFICGDPDRAPLQGPPHESEYASGIHGFIAAMAALWARERTGRGQVADVSHFEVMASLNQYMVEMWTHGHFVQGRVGNATPGLWHPNTHVRCRDGEIAVNAGGRDRRVRMLGVMGLDHLLEDPRFATEPALDVHRDEFDAILAPWFAERDMADVIELFQAIRVPAAPVRGLHDVLAYEHLQARGFWRVPDNECGVRYPRGPFLISGHDSIIRPAPALGSVDAGLLDRFVDDQPMRSTGVELAAGPLEGLRVLDLGAGWAGPFAGRMLGDLGADVVRIEPPWGRGPRVVSREQAAALHLYPDDDPCEQPWNRQGMNNHWGRNRRTVSIRLDTPEGHRVAEQLVQRSDILLENFTPRVMPNLGLSFAQLQELNPSLLYLHLPGYGTSGPDVNFASLGPAIEAAAGICALIGYPDKGPQRQGMAFPDAISGMSAVAGALIALWDRAADPNHAARDIEGAQIEATVCFAGDALLAAQASGHEPPFLGNRHPVFAPQGCYPCSGPDRWITITVTSDKEWVRLCRLVGLPEAWASLNPSGRRSNHDAIDAALTGWTRQHEAQALMARLQEQGIAAGAVLSARDLVDDPQLGARAFFAMLGREGYGCFPFGGLPMHLSDTPGTYRIASPRLGEFNDEVLTELDWTAAEIARLREIGIVHDAPPQE